jgi:hypothetical protein
MQGDPRNFPKLNVEQQALKRGTFGSQEKILRGPEGQGVKSRAAHQAAQSATLKLVVVNDSNTHCSGNAHGTMPAGYNYLLYARYCP